MNIIIKSTSWSGRNTDYIPNEETNKISVEIGKKCFLDSQSLFNLSIEIIEVNDDYIKIKTDTPMSLGAGKINLLTKDTEFIVKLNDTITLKTPTLDCGKKYELSLEK